VSRTFISIDPGLRNTALVWGIIENGVLVPHYWDYVGTKSLKGEKTGFGAVRRARMINKKIAQYTRGFDIAFGEVPNGSQSAAAMKGLGISAYLLATINIPMVEVSPMDVKKVINPRAGKAKFKGSKERVEVSKEDVMEYCYKKYPNFPYERKKKTGAVVLARMEHVCDAIVIAEAGMKKENYKVIISQLN